VETLELNCEAENELKSSAYCHPSSTKFEAKKPSGKKKPTLKNKSRHRDNNEIERGMPDRKECMVNGKD